MQNQGGGREPVVVRNGLVASLDEHTVRNVASYYASLAPGTTSKREERCCGARSCRVSFTRPADGSSPGGIVSFRKNDPSRRVEQNNAICLGCHERGDRTYWNGSTHETRGVACTECHTVMRQVSRKSALKTVDRDGNLLPVPQGPARADIPLVPHAVARRQDNLLQLSQSARQRHRSDAEGKLDQRHLLQVPCRKARTVPVRTCAGAGKLPELSRRRTAAIPNTC